MNVQVRSRSGLAAKYGIFALNAPGTVDSDYRGEIKVILSNFGSEKFIINRGDRIAQLVIARYERISWQEVKELDETERGAGGFGSTGISLMNDKLKIIFMGTPEFSVPALEKIHELYGIECVVTVPDKPQGRGLVLKPSSVKQKALELGINVLQA